MTQVTTRKRYLSPRRSAHGPFKEPRSALAPGKITRREWLRFLSKVQLGDLCQCQEERGAHRHWIWTRVAQGDGGYGKLKWRGRMYYAHRFAYVAFGGTIPEDMEPDHLCRLRACCNPACIEIVPQYDNWVRGEAPSAHNKCKRTCMRGHLLSEENLLPGAKRRGVRQCKLCHYSRTNQWDKNHPDQRRRRAAKSRRLGARRAS
jgi:hypothetical protein